MPREYTLAQAAKALGTGRTRLCRDLKAHKILDQHCLPYQQHDVDCGRFVVRLRHHNGNPHINDGCGQTYAKTYVTQKGLRWLADLMGVEIEEAA